MSEPADQPAAQAVTGPLSFQQRQIWLAERDAIQSGLYHEACLLRLRGNLDVKRLDAALTASVARHEALRSTFPLDGGEPVQRVGPAYPIRLDPAMDLSYVPERDRLKELTTLAQAIVEAPFDISHGPPLRARLFALGPDDHALLLTVHHLVCDGQSLRLLLHELARRYAGGGPGPAVPGYPRYAREQPHWLAGPAATADIEAWTDALDGAPDVTELAPAAPRPPVQTHRGKREAITIAPQTRDALTRLLPLAAGSRLAVLAALFGVLIHRYNGERDIVVGTGVDPRPDRYAETLGCFAAVVPLRLRPAGTERVRDLLEAASNTVFDALDLAAVPLERIVDHRATARDPSYLPLVQLVCTVWDRDYRRISVGDLDGTLLEVPRDRARFDLVVEHVFDPDAWTLYVEYDTALFDPGFVRQLAGHYERLIRAAAADPDATTVALPMLGSDDAEVPGGPHVVDGSGNRLPVGAIGELREAATGTVKTGQVARRRPDGSVDVLGALHRRRRVGGLWLQEEQVETLLREHPGVTRASVAEAGGGSVARVVLAAGTSLGEVTGHLKARLPKIQLPTLAIDGLRSAGEAPEPATDRIERTVAEVWRRLLNVPDIRPDEDFFQLGGRSMLAAQAAEQLSDAFGVRLRIRDLFMCPTVRELAATLVERFPQLATPRSVSPALPASGEALRHSPVSQAQLQIWLNEQMTLGAADDFNSALAHHLHGALDVAALRRALSLVVAQHPLLRGSFPLVEELPELRVAARAEVSLKMFTVAHLAQPDRFAEAVRIAREGCRERFDLTAPPLLRVLLIRISDDEHLLAYAMHHLITDSVSLGLFHRDLRTCYIAARDGTEPALPRAAPHYGDYVAWEREWLVSPASEAARRYWKRTLAGLPELRLPARVPGRRTNLSVSARRRTLPVPLSRRLAAFARSCRATTFMTVTAAFCAVLGRWSGQRDLVIGTLGDNRPSGALREVMGCFAGFLPLRVGYDETLTLGELAARVRDVILGAYEHQSLPFGEILQLTSARRSFSRMPLFQVTVQQVSPEETSLNLPGCAAEPVIVTPDVSRFEITLFVAEHPDAVELTLEFADQLWTETEIDERLDQIVALLDEGSRNPARPIAENAGPATNPGLQAFERSY
jgi:non-ribosomal peptide synthetase component F